MLCLVRLLQEGPDLESNKNGNLKLVTKKAKESLLHYQAAKNATSN